MEVGFFFTLFPIRTDFPLTERVYGPSSPNRWPSGEGRLTDVSGLTRGTEPAMVSVQCTFGESAVVSDHFVEAEGAAPIPLSAPVAAVTGLQSSNLLSHDQQ